MPAGEQSGSPRFLSAVQRTPRFLAYSARMRATCRSSFREAIAASWMKVGVPESMLVFTFLKRETRRASPATQPIRQPVIAERLEKDWKTTTPSLPGPANSSTERGGVAP